MLLSTVLNAQTPSISTLALPATVGGNNMVWDSAGNIYSYQSGPVTRGAYQTTNGGGSCLFSNGFFALPGPCGDGYVGKFDPSGKLIFGTYIGGNTSDRITAMAFDASSNIIVAGTTEGGFPTTPNVAFSSSSANSKSFVAKLSADGSRLLYSTYLPTSIAIPYALAMDAQSNVFVAGLSSSDHAIVLKLNADVTSLVYTVPLAGSNHDFANAIRSDANGNVIVAGSTYSLDFPVTPNALQSKLKGVQNLFLARIDPNGRVVTATYLGGAGKEEVSSLQTDTLGNVYIAGQTTSPDFPTTPGSFEPSAIVPMWNTMGPGGFAAKLPGDFSTLTWSTFMMSGDPFLYTSGTPLYAGVTHLITTASGDVFVSGLSGAGFPTTPSAPQSCFSGPISNVFVARLDARGALADATYIGPNTSYPSGLFTNGDGAVQVAYNKGSIVSTVRFGAKGGAGAACLSPNILNSATFVQSNNIVPGELISLTGLGIGPDTPSTTNVQVLFDGLPAPVLYAQSRQINVQAPVELDGKSQTMISVVYNNLTIGTITTKVDRFGAPGLFRLHPGLAVDTAALNQDGTVNSRTNPASKGSVISTWGTGFGMITPACKTGELNPDQAVSLSLPLLVSFSEANPDPNAFPAKPTYSGSAPGLLCGIVQINRTIPDWVAPGAFYFSANSGLQSPQGSVALVGSPVNGIVYVK